MGRVYTAKKLRPSAIPEHTWIGMPPEPRSFPVNHDDEYWDEEALKLAVIAPDLFNAMTRDAFPGDGTLGMIKLRLVDQSFRETKEGAACLIKACRRARLLTAKAPGGCTAPGAVKRQTS